MPLISLKYRVIVTVCSIFSIYPACSLISSIGRSSSIESFLSPSAAVLISELFNFPDVTLAFAFLGVVASAPLSEFCAFVACRPAFAFVAGGDCSRVDIVCHYFRRFHSRRILTMGPQFSSVPLFARGHCVQWRVALSFFFFNARKN